MNCRTLVDKRSDVIIFFCLLCQNNGSFHFLNRNQIALLTQKLRRFTFAFDIFALMPIRLEFLWNETKHSKFMFHVLYFILFKHFWCQLPHLPVFVIIVFFCHIFVITSLKVKLGFEPPFGNHGSDCDSQTFIARPESFTFKFYFPPPNQ